LGERKRAHRVEELKNIKTNKIMRKRGERLWMRAAFNAISADGGEREGVQGNSRSCRVGMKDNPVEVSLDLSQKRKTNVSSQGKKSNVSKKTEQSEGF